jgi:hypothetical protein
MDGYRSTWSLSCALVSCRPYCPQHEVSILSSAMKSYGTWYFRLQWVPTHSYIIIPLIPSLPLVQDVKHPLTHTGWFDWWRNQRLRWLEPLLSNLLVPMYDATTHTRSLRTLDMDAVISGSPTTNFQETASATYKHKPYSDVHQLKYSCMMLIK